jgi:uncharacterized repeat protein (TIGR02543 family)
VGSHSARTYTVTFNSQGGSSVSPVTVNSGDTLALPAPTKAGNILSGWYTEENGSGTKFTGTTQVTGNITLYAKWTAAPSGGGKGKLTITGIPEGVHGSYVLATTEDQTFWGLAEKPASTPTSLKAVEITGTTVEIPLWKNNNGSWAVYEGNESKKVILCIGNSVNAPTTNLPDWGETLTSSSAITFANGSTTAEASLFFDDEGGGDGVPYGELAEYLDRLDLKTAADPNIVKIAAVNISTGGVMGAINDAVLAGKKYVTLDLSACSATGNTIKGLSSDNAPGPDHMNVIRNNQYIVGIILPSSATIIDYHAFRGCSSLVSVTIPSGIISIKNYAFMNCSGLTSVTIPGSVKDIGSGAFSSCSSLASVTFAAGSDITRENFDSDGYGSPFPGDLREKYLAVDGSGGAGTYTRNPSESTWTKTPQ